ncbi:NAD-dependent epimerase/dehydratase family protein [Methylobacterium sp. NEAU 140]|uniref:NAD-dependent epimerase/dehydratase family protein n=1 Tax=Methylobacterium sp. NEAU 140 TaxID=3064945 RepID=UPI0027365C57|nr:NAD-dependent epimerase/dehydratase family protein [Methylobacterium sp. NEAU 140]MDP4025869.1 NAD-dependent epimerase/dehydratase family protein [Methylobacterium sp. NEAU 140]
MLTHLNTSPRMPTRAVVIGGAGFVGGAVARRLSAESLEILSLGRTEVDLLAPDAGERLARLLRSGDAVVFAAARAPCRDVGMMIDNLAIVGAVLDAFAAAPPAHVVNISSDAVYGDEAVPLTEAMAPAPTSMHGAMHLAREIALRGAVGDRLATLRPTLIYGAGDPHNGYGPNRFRRLAARGEEIALFGDGEERRDHVSVDDVADLAARMVLHRSIGVLNAATGTVHSFREAAELAVAQAKPATGGRRSTIRGTPRSGPMPHNGFRPFDPAATYGAFPGFRYTGLEEGMARAAADSRS